MRPIKYLAIFIVITLFLPITAIAQSGDGVLAGAFLRMGVGARALAMGGAFTAVADGPATSYYNPAGVPFIQKRQIMASHRVLSLDRNFNFLGYAQNISPKVDPEIDEVVFNGGIAASWIYAGVHDIDGRGYNGQHTMNYSNAEHALSLTFGISPLEFIGIGLTGRYLHNFFPKLQQDDSAISEKTIGLDLGVLIKPTSFLSIGFMVKDLNAKYDWKTDEVYEKDIDKIDYFPTTYRGGIALSYPYDWLLLAIDYEKNEEQDGKLFIGVEAQPISKFAFRAGLNNGNFSGGFGYQFKIFNRHAEIMYALVTKDYDVSSEHVFSWLFEI